MGLTSLLNRTADRLNRFVDEGEAARSGVVFIDQPTPPSRRPPPKPPREYRKRDAKPLDEDQIDSFLLASGEYYRERRQREGKPATTTAQERDDFIKWLGRRNPTRIRRIGRDFDWLRAQAKKYGMNPEDVRWLL